MDVIFYLTGVSVFFTVLVVIGWLFVVELLIVGLATSISYWRWNVRISSHKFTIKDWPKLLWFILSDAVVEFWGYRNNGSTSITHQGNGKTWRGIGDWTE